MTFVNAFLLIMTSKYVNDLNYFSTLYIFEFFA